MLFRTRIKNQRWRVYANLLVNENRWRAMRYSFDEGLIDLGRGKVIDFPILLEELIEFIMEDADALGCVEEIIGLRNILEEGTSAHSQIKLYNSALESGATKEQALRDVVDWLIRQTVKGV